MYSIATGAKYPVVVGLGKHVTMTKGEVNTYSRLRGILIKIAMVTFINLEL